MKGKILGTLVGIGLVMAAVAAAQQRGEGYIPRTVASPPSVSAGTELIVATMALSDNKAQMLTVVDPRQRVMCVYHIDAATGKIALKSVRNIQWDLRINDLNNEKPLPEEIRSLLEPR